MLVLKTKPDMCYVISKLVVEHDRSLELRSTYLQNRLLTASKKETFADVAKCNIKPKDFKNYVYEKTGKTLTTQDINNYKSRSVNSVTSVKTSEAHGALLLEQLHSLASKNPNRIIHYEKDKK